MNTHHDRLTGLVRRRLSGYGMLGVLLLLCVLFSALTLQDQHPTGKRAAAELASELIAHAELDASILILARDSEQDRAFVDDLAGRLRGDGFTVPGCSIGSLRLRLVIRYTDHR